MKRVLTICIVLICMGMQPQTLEGYFKIAADNNPGLLSQHREFEAALQKYLR